MNPELNERLTTLLDYIGNTVKDADTFARGQAPLVAEEIIRWYIAESILGILLALVFLSLTIFFCWLILKMEKHGVPPSEAGGGCVVGAIICGLLAIIIGSVNVNHLVRGLTQPRVIVLDYVRSIK